MQETRSKTHNALTYDHTRYDHWTEQKHTNDSFYDKSEYIMIVAAKSCEPSTKLGPLTTMGPWRLPSLPYG